MSDGAIPSLGRCPKHARSRDRAASLAQSHRTRHQPVASVVIVHNAAGTTTGEPERILALRASIACATIAERRRMAPIPESELERSPLGIERGAPASECEDASRLVSQVQLEQVWILTKPLGRNLRDQEGTILSRIAVAPNAVNRAQMPGCSPQRTVA